MEGYQGYNLVFSEADQELDADVQSANQRITEAVERLLGEHRPGTPTHPKRMKVWESEDHVIVREGCY